MIRCLVAALLLAGLGGDCAAPAQAPDPPRPLYLLMVEKYPAPILKDVHAREFKYLVDPARVPKDPQAAFQEIWARIRAESGKAGFTVSGKKDKKTLKIGASAKEYLDTPDQDLWKQGCLIRVTSKSKNGGKSRTITVKAIFEDAARTLATPLVVVGAESTTDAEGNVGLIRDGQLGEYVEKGTTWTVAPDQLGTLTLGDFGKFMPELLKLGLPATTQLVSTKVYAVHVKPGRLESPGSEPSPFALEGWSRKEGGDIFLYEISYRIGGLDYYNSPQAHLAGEQFLSRVLQGGMKDLALPQSTRWGGSKVRLLMNRPSTE
jgi:hypothetical protein